MLSALAITTVILLYTYRIFGFVFHTFYADEPATVIPNHQWYAAVMIGALITPMSFAQMVNRKIFRKNRHGEPIIPKPIFGSVKINLWYTALLGVILFCSGLLNMTAFTDSKIYFIHISNWGKAETITFDNVQQITFFADIRTVYGKSRTRPRSCDTRYNVLVVPKSKTASQEFFVGILERPYLYDLSNKMKTSLVHPDVSYTSSCVISDWERNEISEIEDGFGVKF